MKKINVLFLLLFPIISCNTTDKVAFTNNKTDKQVMIMKGYLAGEISLSNKDGDCPVTIAVNGENGTYYLDPINLEEKYHIDGLNVWFKYGGLRRMNRCLKANPVTINEIVTD